MAAVKITICELCNSRFANHAHHLYSNTKQNRKLYSTLLDREENIIHLCADCHLYKPIPKLTEIQFCERLKIIPRSKIGKLIWERMKNERPE